MATFNKFYNFAYQESKGVHVFGTHQFKVMLTNSAPVSTNSIKTDITEIAAGNGYTAGGTVIPNLGISTSGGVTTVYGDMVTFTASGGTMGPFRYAVMYNNTATNKDLVGWWDYGTSTTLADTETFDWKPNNASTAGTIFTKS